MQILELARQKAFWMIDALKGSPIRKHLDDITFMFENWGTKECQERSEKHLLDLLSHATSNTAFYAKYKGFKSLQDFPVINKAVVRDNESMFLAAGYEKDKLFKQETSGSTGMPFAVYQDALKRQRATADTLYFSKRAGYELGTRLYFSRVWEEASKRSKLTCFKQNWVTHDSSSLSDEAIHDLYEQWEKDSSTKSVLIFASTLTAIAKYIERNQLQPKAKIECFITLSEALEPWTKKTIEARYKTNVFSRYSNQELGIMAQQYPGSTDFFVNIGSFYFEILDMQEDKPAKPGEEGRIVVTDLFSRSMPLIRYDTGDIAILKPGLKVTDVPVFEKVGGRRVDYIFDTNDNPVSPYVINTPMHEFLEIQQYQFIQEGAKDYTMLLNLKEEKVFAQETVMVDMLKSYLGADANIVVKYVSEIPVLKSGKRKQVVNKYKSL